MKNKIALMFIILAVVAAFIAGLVLPKVALAVAPTTQVHIVKYAADGTTIIDEVTKTYQWLEANLPVQGNGTTHYYTQGPTFDPNDIWDPNENYDLEHSTSDSLKDKGALKGTDVKDLCELVEGGMGVNDTVTIRASDGYGNDIWPYANVYTPDPRQGKMVICWYNGNVIDEDTGEELSPGYVPNYTKGMLLAFFPDASTARSEDGKIIFGHQDMHDCFPEDNYHWYSSEGINYPSTNGAYYKWVSEIKIYTDGATNWNLSLSGARSDSISKAHFENCIACHTSNGSATLKFDPLYTDPEGNTWKGVPLWMIVGYVDDSNNAHGVGSFNDNLYYNVKVTGAGGYNYTFESTQVAHQDDYILANEWQPTGATEFVTLPEDKWPLKLVSPHFTVGGPSVAGIESIQLLNIGTTPPSYPPINPVPAEWPLKLYGAQTSTITQSSFESCAGCHQGSYTEGTDTWTGIPLWRLLATVDDTNWSHSAGDFNDEQASWGYDVVAIGADTYSYTFSGSTGSAYLARNNNIIVANKLNGEVLPPEDEGHPVYPLKLVGDLGGTGWRIGSLVRVDLRNFQSEPVLTHPWDLNNDHICDIGDVVKLGLKWGQTGAGGWIPEDLNSDGIIDIGDVVKLGLNWNATW